MAETPAALKLYQQEIAKAISNEEVHLAQLQRYHTETKQVEALLSDLVQKVSHKVLVPFGKHAFFHGELRHTNELTVHLGARMYVECSTSEAGGILNRRAAMIARSMASSEKQLDSLRTRIDLAASTVGEGQDYLEIRQTHEESEQLLGSVSAPAPRAPMTASPAADDAEFDRIFARIAELEQLELDEECSGRGQQSMGSQMPPEHEASIAQLQRDAAAFTAVPLPSSASGWRQHDNGASSSTSTSQPIPLAAPSSSTPSAKPGFGFKKGFLASSKPAEPASPSNNQPAMAAGSTASVTSQQQPTQRQALPSNQRAAFTGQVFERSGQGQHQEGSWTQPQQEAKPVSKFKQKRMGLG